MSVLILAEKPNQAKAYAEAFPKVEKRDGHFYVPPCPLLPSGGNITWAYGHLVELKSPQDYKKEWEKWDLSQLPILPSRYEYKVSADKKKQFNIIKKLMKEAEIIQISTDIDREGEAIARLIIQEAGCTHKKIKRLWINSLEVDEIKKGFQNLKPGEDFESMFEEAQARQLSDWIVGMNASRLYTLLLRKKGVQGVYSVGRCQTPALFLINKRQQEIKNFKPTPFFELEAQFTSPNGVYMGRYKERFATKGDLMSLLQQHSLSENNNQQGMIKSVEVKPKQQEAPKLFSLSSIQALANKKYKYSPADVLKGIQELYEAKLVTYPRTDCNYITESEFEYLKNNLSGYQSIASVNFQPYSLTANKRYVDNKKVQEHYAIVLTKNVPSRETIARLTDKQRNLYMEVLKSVLSMFHAPYMYEETVITSDLNGLLFTTKGKAEKSLGWKELYVTDKIEEEDDQEKVSLLPVVKQGEFVQGLVKSKEGVTTPPKPYTEGQLITMMKTCGSSVEDEESKIILKEVEGLGTEATRAGIIETLKKQGYIEVKRNKVSVTPKGEILCESVQGTMLAKPELTAKWEGYLRKIGKNQGSKDKFVSETSKFINDLIKRATESIGELKIDNKIQDMKAKDTIGKCPKCGKDVVNRKTFYGCSGYKEGCKFSISGEYLTKKISEANAKKLLEGKKTSLIKKMKGKSGVEFDGYLKLTVSGRLDLEFASKGK
ncbi:MULTISPECIES: type IA DNA topoisomerase [Bacillus cereus group]|uniref:type IA DNA topoisomerase n=1 Tax=Bacillus cereus group TaxID=86661 RepID=UPI00187901E8|nr:MULTISPECIES: type IA DNA topoisomerase [Bacillus cereus group]MBE7145277.1 DNA topoisomerase III [Bacillus paranthracis]MCU5211717.1 DNA topoisomerase 3 [Bacillus paranthracis]MDA2593695.1 DNA topoisomerase 3 [Bacillus cereus group sp. Bc065]HDR7527210.1 DNA topoisomerase 3 [Bacillus paranthracis]